MSNIMQDLHTVGLNPFAVTLLAESLLKSPLAPLTVGKPQGFFFPIQRSDCPGWVGVRITLEAVPKDAALAAAPQAVPLTDEQINAIWNAKDLPEHRSNLSPWGMARVRAIIAAAQGITAKGEQ